MGSDESSNAPEPVGLVYAIQEAADALEDRLIPLTAAAGLTLPQFRLLYCVVGNGVAENEPMRLSDLALHRRCVKSNISNLVRTMEREGLVALQQAPNDGRARLVQATGLGASKYGKVIAAGRKLETELARRLGPRRASTLGQLSIAAAQHLDDNWEQSF